jgi:hypothetical protein
MRHEMQLALDRSNPPTGEHCDPFPLEVRFLVQTIGTLEDMLDGLGVGDPQAVFLLQREDTLRLIHGKTAHPKQPIPANDGSVFFQKLLLDDNGLARYPRPCVTCLV